MMLKNIKQIANNETSLVEKTKKTKDDKLSNKSELKKINKKQE